jgi:PAS domain S-box-containing protein
MFIDDLKILLIDKDPEIRKKIKDIVVGIDDEYEVTCIETAFQAKEIIKESPNYHKCIFFNYNLPDSNGADFLEELKTWHTTSLIAIYDDEPDYKKAMNLIKNGAFDYFKTSEINTKRIDKVISSVFRRLILDNEKKDYLRKIKEKDKTIKAITKSSPNLIYVYDIPEKTVIFYNRNIFEQLGYRTYAFKYGNKITALFKELMSETGFNKLNKHISKIFKTDKDDIFEFEFRIKNAQGEWVWFLRKDLVFKRDEKNNPTQILVTVSNISKLKEAEKGLKEAKKEAENSAKIKAEFLSNMSHEIRTPMNAIIGLTDIVLGENLPNSIEENLGSVKQSAENLLVIINDILDLSKLEAGKVRIEKIPFDLKDKMSHLCKVIKPKIKDKPITFNCHIDESINTNLIGDPFRLNQILLNLLSNAIKFTEEGTVDLIIKAVKKGKKKTSLSFSVIDTGLGIAKDKQKTIFESFTQADLSTTRNFGGTGLGLTITKLLVQLLKGSISLSSKLGKGTNFTVTLDFEISTENIEKVGDQQLEEEYENASILVVEDNLINQKVISQILRNWKIKFEIANHGKQALELLGKHEFDLILMDLQMPILDGFETTNQIRNNKAYTHVKNIPIIALTADAFLETKNKVFQSKMDDYVSKPFNKLELNSKIGKLIKH